MGHVTALVDHAFARRFSQVAEMLAAGCSPQQLAATDSYGATALHYTTMGVQPELSQQLIDAGAPVNAGDHEGRTPLHSAAYRARIEMCTILLKAGASMTARDRRDATPYEYGCDHPQVVELFLTAGFDVHTTNSQGVSAIHLAARAGVAAADVLEQLLLRGADPRARTAKQWTPLHYALHTRRLTPALLDGLLDAGARLDDRDDEGNTAAHLLALDRRPEFLAQIFKHAYGIDPMRVAAATTTEGKTPLHYAARSGDCNCINLLLDHGAPIDARDTLGNTPLHEAAKAGHLQAFARLLARSANPRLSRETGETPLELAEPRKVASFAQTLAIVLTPSEAQARDCACQSAREYLRDDQLQSAQLQVRRALDLDPACATGLAIRGQLEHRRGDTQAAVDNLLRAANLAPDDPDILSALGFVEADRRRFAIAREHYTRALQLDADHLLTRVRRAYAHVRLRQNQAAIADYRAYLAGGGGDLFGDTYEVEQALRELEAGDL